MPGTHYLLSWLVRRGSSVATVGKYEMTLGPHIWYGYASGDVQKAAQEQVGGADMRRVMCRERRRSR